MGRSQSRQSLKYETLKKDIAQAINSGEYKPGDRLPSQNELATKYELSPNTVREAISSLAHEGLLYRVQGSGTFVAERQTDPKTIALIIPNVPWEDEGSGSPAREMGFRFFYQIVHSVEEEVRRSNSRFTLYLDRNSIEMERDNIMDALSHKADAIIVLYIGDRENIECLAAVEAAGVPLVLIDKYAEGLDVDYVTTDNFSGAYRATCQLIDDGYDRVFHLTHQADWTTTVDRRTGYEEAMRRRGLQIRLVAADHPLRDAIHEEEAGYTLTRKILQTEEPPFALFALNSPMLGGAWRAVSESGVCLQDVAFACFDYPQISFPTGVRCLEVEQPLEEMGRRAVQIAVEKLNGHVGTRRLLLEPRLRVISNGESVTQLGTLQYIR